MELQNGPTRQIAASSVGNYILVKKEAEESSYVHQT